MTLASPSQRETVRPLRRQRHALALVLTVIAAAGTWLAVALQEASLWQSGYSTGWVLLGCLFFLAAYNLRKKIPCLPLAGTSRWWMQLHIYVALFSIAVFAMHIGWAMPDGGFEQLLAGLYVLVAGSGVYGLYATRTVPRRLTATGYEVIFEQIPGRRRHLARQARTLVLDTVAGTDVLARHYVNQLVHFMERPRSLAYNASPSLRRSRLLVEEIHQLDRYLTGAQRQASRDLAALVREKEDLDYHWALQGRLKLWLFLHIGLTYGLLVCAVLHGILAHSFAGGLR